MHDFSGVCLQSHSVRERRGLADCSCRCRDIDVNDHGDVVIGIAGAAARYLANPL